MIHRKKNRPALQRRDILTVSLASSCFRNLLRSSSTQNLVVLFFKACYTLTFSSKHFFLGLFVRSLSTQLLFLVVLLPLLLSMTAFSYVGLLSLFLVRLFHALYLSHLPPSSFLEGLSSEQFAELESVRLLAFFSSRLFFGLSIISVSVLNNLQGRFHILSSFCGLFIGLSLFSVSVDFSCSEGSFSLFFSKEFSCVCYRGFLLSGSVLSSRAALSSENACY